jgi:uncharacterized protein
MRRTFTVASLQTAAVAILCTLAPSGHAQQVVELGTLAGPAAAPVRKHVRTLRDLRYRDLMPQKYDFSCGSAALATLLQYGYGIETSETELIRQMLVGTDANEVVRNGFSMLDMKRYVESIGMRGHGFKVKVDALYRLQMPVITLLEIKGYKHFVVVKGAAAGRIFVADPALGHRVMVETDFLNGWNGVVLAVIGDSPMRSDSYLVNSRTSPALMRRVDALERAVTPPRVVEFGLVHTDLL